MAPQDRTDSKTLDAQAVAELCVRRLQDELPSLDPSERDLLSCEARIKVRRGMGRAGAIDLAGHVTRVAAQTAAGYRRRRTIWESVLLPWIDEAVDGTLQSTISTGTLGHLVDRAWFVALEVLAGGRAGASAEMIRMRVGGKAWSAAAADAGLSTEAVTDRWQRHGRDRLAGAARLFDGLFLYWRWFDGDASGDRAESEHTWTRRRLAAYVARLLDDVEEHRFQRHLEGCGSCWFALGAVSEDPRPDEATEGHIPASILARWEQAGDVLVGLERAMVRRHLERCSGCREDLRLVGFEPVLAFVESVDREVDLAEPERVEDEEPLAVASTASAASPEPAPAFSESRVGYVVIGSPTPPRIPAPPAPPPRLEEDDPPRPDPADAPAKAGGMWKGALAFLSVGSSPGATRSRPWSAASASKRAPRGNLGRLTEAWTRLREYMVGGPAALRPEAAEEFLALQGEIARILPILHEEFRAANLRELAHLASRRARDLLADVPTIRSMQSRLGLNREELDRIWHEVFLILAELAGRGR